MLCKAPLINKARITRGLGGPGECTECGVGEGSEAAGGLRNDAGVCGRAVGGLAVGGRASGGDRHAGAKEVDTYGDKGTMRAGNYGCWGTDGMSRTELATGGAPTIYMVGVRARNHRHTHAQLQLRANPPARPTLQPEARCR